MLQNPVKNNDTWLIAIFFFFFIQQTTFLVEAIYMLDLLHTSLDAKALGVLFFYFPLLLLSAKSGVGKKLLLSIGLLFILSSLLTPWVNTSSRILTAGVAVGSFLLFMAIFVPRRESTKVNWIGALAVATMATITFKVLGASLDISAIGPTRIIGFVLVAIATFTLLNTLATDSAALPGKQAPTEIALSAAHYLAALGFLSSIILLYFVFASPGVVVRWTESNMQGVHIVLLVSILSLLALVAFRPKLIVLLQKHHLVLWNILFMFFLFMTIHLHSITPPATPGSPPVVVAETHGYFNIFTYIMLGLMPIIFLNASVFVRELGTLHAYQWAGPLTVAGVYFSVLIFMLIFTNVWGYVGELSLFFRNKFYLPFLLACVGMTVPYFFLNKVSFRNSGAAAGKSLFAVAALFSLLVFVHLGKTDHPWPANPSANRLTVMTFNIQQGVDFVGNKNYLHQLEIIKRVNPDILCLQESDVARISGGNSDVVGYFAQKLNYFSYYGPKTVTGTFGTAILSRFPLLQRKSIFTYSDSDEVGTAFSEIHFAGKSIAIFSNHPAGSKVAKQAHIEMLVSETKKHEYVLAMGDFNFTQESPYYRKIAAVLVDSWLAVWPNGVGDLSKVGIRKGEFDPRAANGVWLDDFHLDMSNRIDHIFVSDNFQVEKSVYLPVPQSQSDHPAHWAVLKFR